MHFTKLVVAMFMPQLGTALAAPKGMNTLSTRVIEDCWASLDEPPSKHWIVYINTPYDNQPDHCGAGHLDNLRGRCGVITSWGCDAIEPGVAIELGFLTSVFCTAYDVTQALAAASGGHIVNCRDVDL